MFDPFQVELDFCKAAPNKGGLKEEKGYQVSWIIDVIFRFWKPFITFKIFKKKGSQVCGIGLCLFNITNFWTPCMTFKIFDTLWKYLMTSFSGLDVYELHIQKVSKYSNFCRQRYELVFKTYDTPNVCFYLEQHRKWLSFIESSMSRIEAALKISTYKNIFWNYVFVRQDWKLCTLQVIFPRRKNSCET